MSLPIILAAGAAVLLLGQKKTKKKSNGATTTATQSPYGPTSGTAAPAPTLPPAVKKQGSGYKNVSRETMQWIQNVLFYAGFTVGNLEGIYDAETKQAVSDFQTHHGGLTVDGKPGKATRDALREIEGIKDPAEGQQAPQEQEKYPLKVTGSDPSMVGKYRGYTILSQYTPGPGGPSDGSGSTFVQIMGPDGIIKHAHSRPWHSSRPQITAREGRTKWGIEYGTFWIDREFSRG